MASCEGGHIELGEVLVLVLVEASEGEDKVHLYHHHLLSVGTFCHR